MVLMDMGKLCPYLPGALGVTASPPSSTLGQYWLEIGYEAMGPKGVDEKSYNKIKIEKMKFGGGRLILLTLLLSDHTCEFFQFLHTGFGAGDLSIVLMPCGS